MGSSEEIIALVRDGLVDAAELVNFMSTSKESARENLVTLRKLHDAGVITKAELLQAQVGALRALSHTTDSASQPPCSPPESPPVGAEGGHSPPARGPSANADRLETEAPSPPPHSTPPPSPPVENPPSTTGAAEARTQAVSANAENAAETAETAGARAIAECAAAPAGPEIIPSLPPAPLSPLPAPPVASPPPLLPPGLGLDHGLDHGLESLSESVDSGPAPAVPAPAPTKPPSPPLRLAPQRPAVGLFRPSALTQLGTPPGLGPPLGRDARSAFRAAGIAAGAAAAGDSDEEDEPSRPDPVGNEPSRPFEAHPPGRRPPPDRAADAPRLPTFAGQRSTAGAPIGGGSSAPSWRSGGASAASAAIGAVGGSNLLGLSSSAAATMARGVNAEVARAAGGGSGGPLSPGGGPSHGHNIWARSPLDDAWGALGGGAGSPPGAAALGSLALSLGHGLESRTHGLESRTHGLESPRGGEPWAGQWARRSEGRPPRERSEERGFYGGSGGGGGGEPIGLGLPALGAFGAKRPLWRGEGPPGGRFAFDPDEAAAGAGHARTTMMLRNIPNKYSQKALLAVLDLKFAGLYSFLYLPIDFRNGCNLGYAFVNLESPEVTQAFHQAFHQRSWHGMNSKKVCEVTYARVQGLPALLEHFRYARFPAEAAEKEDFLPLIRADKLREHTGGLPAAAAAAAVRAAGSALPGEPAPMVPIPLGSAHQVFHSPAVAGPPIGLGLSPGITASLHPGGLGHHGGQGGFQGPVHGGHRSAPVHSAGYTNWAAGGGYHHDDRDRDREFGFRMERSSGGHGSWAGN